MTEGNKAHAAAIEVLDADDELTLDNGVSSLLLMRSSV